MKKTDKQLGMDAGITRRDFIQDTGLTALGLALTPAALGEVSSEDLSISPSPHSRANYPPIRTGMRGSHPGAFEVAHALAREGKSFPAPEDLDEEYDLVVVGAGVSGLAAARYYRQRYGEDSRILLIENHDDFGGHSKRNEFHQGGQMRLSMGGTHNLEWWEFSDTVNELLDDLDVDPQGMMSNMEFDYGRGAPNSPATWFDEESYGVNRLVPQCDVSGGPHPKASAIDALPISGDARARLKRFYSMRKDVLAGQSKGERSAYLTSISYTDFLRQHGELNDEAIQLFDKLNHGMWGVEMRALSAAEVLDGGFPGLHLLGGDLDDGDWDYPISMWPDGNASLTRLLIADLIPSVAPGTTADNVAIAAFDYSRLDVPGEPVRLRLESTVINAEESGDSVFVSYVNGGKVHRVKSRHCVMACYHVIIPHLCPTLPEAQQEAMRYQTKIPLHLTNVLIRNTEALDRLGIDYVNCPGRLHGALFTFRGINTGGYKHALSEKGPVPLVFWGSISPPKEAKDIKTQLRASTAHMLSLSFEDYEREVRTVLDGLLGPAGFDVKRDILAITVNRWPHGYAYEYLDLWDGDWKEGQAPHLIARQPFGRITIANADAGASAYTHVAIDQAYRAVEELPA